jgi:Putative Actinobacterial Holin-X, holin superfamily III
MTPGTGVFRRRSVRLSDPGVVGTAVETPQRGSVPSEGVRDEYSTVQLVRIASDQISRLMRAEIQLAKTELAEKGKRAGLGAGLMAGAGVVAVYGVGAAIATVALAIAVALPAWAAALIVTGGLFLFAGLLVLIGRAALKRGLPPVPTATVASVRADLDAAKQAVSERHPT